MFTSEPGAGGAEALEARGGKLPGGGEEHAQKIKLLQRKNIIRNRSHALKRQSTTLKKWL